MNEHSNDGVHDVFNHQRVLFFIIGYSMSKSNKYKLYKGVIFLFYLYIQAMALFAASMVPKDVSILCVHTFLIGLYASWTLMSRIVFEESLYKSRTTMLSGIFAYVDEQEDKEINTMHEFTVSDIKKRTRIISTTYIVLGIYNLIVMPTMTILSSENDGLDHSQDVLNKFLPYPIYTPFNSHTIIGFTGGMFWCVVYAFGGFGGGVTVISIFLSCALQLKGHLQVLNYSLRNIQKRAYGKYRNLQRQDTHSLTEEIFLGKEFQNCMFTCLRENVRHHQQLLRFVKEFQPYIGAVFFISGALGSLSYGCSLYILLQDTTLDMKINLVMTLFAEFVYNYYICYIGQEVFDEAEKLRGSLYATPWYLCDKKFNLILDTFLCRCLEPITIKSSIFTFTASVEQFAAAMSGMYKITNLVRA